MSFWFDCERDRILVSLNTLRAQLKSIYAKTGVNSQAQLVRRILTSPVLVNTLGGK